MHSNIQPTERLFRTNRGFSATALKENKNPNSFKRIWGHFLEVVDIFTLVDKFVLKRQWFVNYASEFPVKTSEVR